MIRPIQTLKRGATLAAALCLPMALWGCDSDPDATAAADPDPVTENGMAAADRTAPAPPAIEPELDPDPVNPAAYAHFAQAIHYERKSTRALFQALRGRHMGNVDAEAIAEFEKASARYWRQAERELVRAVKLDPHAAYPLIYWGEQLLRREAPRRAAAVLRRASKVPIDDVELAYKLARLMSEDPGEGGPDLSAEAVPVYESILAAPDTREKRKIEAFVYLSLAERYEAAGEVEKALEMVQAFVDIPQEQHDLYIGNERYHRLLENTDPLVRQMARYRLRLDRPAEALETLERLEGDARTSPDTRLLEIRALIALKRFDEAVTLAAGQVEDEEDRGRALRFQGLRVEGLLRQKKLLEALSVLAGAVERPAEFDVLYNYNRESVLEQAGDPVDLRDTLVDRNAELLQSPYIHFVIGQVAEKADKEAMAEKHFRQALEIRRTFYRSAFELGRSLARQGRFEEAFELAMNKSRFQSAWQLNLRELLAKLPAEMVEKGQSEAALIVFARILDAGDPYSRLMVFADDVLVPLTKEGPVEKATKLLDDNPTMKNSSAAFNYLCGELFARGADYEKAAACYRRALPKVDPAQPLADELHLSLGDALRRMGREDEALDRFRKIPTGRDKYVSAAIAMAFIHMDRDEFDKAHGLVRDLVAMQPDNVWLHGVAARIKARQFGLDKGIEALKSSAKKHNFEEHPIYRRTLAGMLIRQKNYDEAIATLNEALSNEQLNERVRHDLREMLAHTHDAAGQDDKAETLYRENLEQAPEGSRATAANGLAYFYAQRGKNLEEAEVLVKSALKTEPSNYAYLDTLGWVYYKQGRLKKALEELRRAESLSEGDGEILKHVAEVLQKLGQTREAFAKWVAAGDAYAGEGQSDEARSAYEQALAIDEAPDVRTKLEKLTKDSTSGAEGEKN